MEDYKTNQLMITGDEIMAKAFINMAGPALILDASGRIVEINQSCASIFRVFKHNLIGRPFTDVLPASEAEKENVRRSFKAAKLSQSPFSYHTFLPTGGITGLNVMINVHNFTHCNSNYSICTLSDISALLHRENEVKEDLEKFNDLFDKFNDLIQSVYPDGSIIFANQKWLDTLGYSQQELSGLHIADIIRKDLVPHCFSILERVKQSEKLEYVETVFVTKEGRDVHVEGNIVGHFENGQFVSSHGIFRDITRRKQVEERYSLLIKNLPIPVYVAKKGVFKFVNSALRNLLEYSENELVGSPTLVLVHPEDRLRVYKMAISSLKADRPSSYEFRLLKKNGEVRWVMETVISIPFESGRATLGALVDFTERKLVEGALEEARNRYQTLFNSASDAIYLHDMDHRLVEVNDAACNLFGYSRADLLKMTVDKIVSPGFVSSRIKEVKDLKEKGSVNVESENVTSSGKLIPTEIRSHIVDYQKKKVGMVVTRDITERKQIEALRQRNETRLESLVKITQFNPGNHQQFLDFTLNELVKLTESQCGYIYLRDQGAASMKLNTWVGDISRECLLHGEPLVCPLEEIGNHEQQMAEGKPRIVNERQSPVIQQNGYPPGAYEIRRHIFYPVFRKGQLVVIVSVANKQTDYDQTDVQQLIIIMDTVSNLLERWKAEDELKKSEKKYRTLVENQSDLVVETDAASLFTFVNPAYCKFIGLAEKDLLSTSGMSRIHPDDYETMSKVLGSLGKSPYTGYSEHRTLTERGWRWVAWVFNGVLDSDGKIKAITSIGRDITESKLAKEELEIANQHLRELDKLKDNLLSMVSHEMRTPLASIKSFAEILLNYDEDRPTRMEFLNIINDESERLTRLINDFLDLSKIQAGRMKWKTEVVSPEEALITAATSAKTLMHKNKLTFTLNIEADLPRVLSDRDRLIQVITNLLNNATKFTPEGGLITLEAWMENKGTSDGQVVFSIKDTGMGIAPENHKSIFEKFGQVGDILKDRPRGTGLGLPICKKIIENYGGKIWLASTLGEGTTFYFSLPAVKRATTESL